MKRKKIQAIGISLITAAFISLLFYQGFFSSWKNRLTDRLFLPDSPSSNIVIVAIDDKSLQRVGQWPWERSVHAKLIDKINSFRPAVIGIDVAFTEPSSVQADMQLIDSVRNANNVVLPTESTLTYENGKIMASDIMKPLKELKEISDGMGLVNTPADPDGVFRRLPIKVFENRSQVPIFAVEISKKYLKQTKNLSVDNIPTDENGRMMVNFAGGPNSYRIVSATDVLDNTLGEDAFQDKVVLIGATAADLHDQMQVPTSFRSPMSGVEVIANQVDTIISKKFLTFFSLTVQTLILFLFLSLLGFILAFMNIRRSLIFSVILLAGYVLIALYLFDQGRVVDIFFPVLGAFLVNLVMTSWRYFSEEKEKMFLKNAFSRYISGDVIEDIIKDPDKLKLGGQKKKMTILFSDIRGFTTISEKLSPEDLVSLLNQYLTKMTDLIMDYSGVVDKYIGDAIMAFWGAPIEEEDHAILACQTALKMKSVVRKNHKKWKTDFDVALNIGIGINTDDVIVGNMGSEKRFDYTVIGDGVNLASRLEGITKYYGVPIVVSGSTQKMAKRDFVFRYLDKVAVKGKAEGVEIYELIAKKETCKQEALEMCSRFQKCVEEYQNRRWQKCIDALNDYSKLYPFDEPAKLLLKRCEKFLIFPPDENWDGAYVLESK